MIPQERISETNGADQDETSAGVPQDRIQERIIFEEEIMWKP